MPRFRDIVPAQIYHSERPWMPKLKKNHPVDISAAVHPMG